MRTDVAFPRVIEGFGPPALLLHGGPGLNDYLAELAGLLVDRLEVVRYTQRGVAPSVLDGPFTVQQHVADARDVLDAWQIGRAILIGHSWGGHLAAQVVAAYPERVSALVSIEGLGLVGDGGWGDFVSHFERSMPAEALERADEIDRRVREHGGTEAESGEMMRLCWPTTSWTHYTLPPAPQFRQNFRVYNDTRHRRENRACLWPPGRLTSRLTRPRTVPPWQPLRISTRRRGRLGGSVGASVWSSAAVNSKSVFITTGNARRARPTQARRSRSSSLTHQRLPARTPGRSRPTSRSPTATSADLPSCSPRRSAEPRSPWSACATRMATTTPSIGSLSTGPVWDDQIGAPWTPSTDRQCLAAGIFDGSHLYLAANQSTSPSMAGSVLEVDPATGATIWRTALPAAIEGTPSLNGSGVIAAASYDQSTTANGAWLVDAATGQILRTFQTNALEFAQPMFAGRYLLLGNV